MFVVHSDVVFQQDPGTPPNYTAANPMTKLLGLVERSHQAAERHFYLPESIQYLVPFGHLDMYGPAGADSQVLNPAQQDNKNDFQKQNVKDFLTTDTYLMRGLVSVGGWTGPFLKLSYDGGPDSKLWEISGGKLGAFIRVWLEVGSAAASQPLRVPYREETDRYELEIWGYPAGDLQSKLDFKGRAALAAGELVVRTDLVQGDVNDFDRGKLEGQDVRTVSPASTMHPVNPLHVEVAWADDTQTFWDSKEGANYQYEFNMILRGFDYFLSAGVNPNPHGGLGFLHFRNLLSNYGRFAGSGELGRDVESWMFDAFGNKAPGTRREEFFAVDYMDLHILLPNCGVGLHRHRDNQEIFFMADGDSYMVVGDWAQFPERERCFEIRRLQTNHFAMLKGGNLHGIMNINDDPVTLFMFGGYD